MYVLQILHGQFFGIHDLIESLNSDKLVQLFILLGSILFQTMGPKLLREHSPFFTELTLGLENFTPILVFIPVSSILNISFIKGGEKSFFALYISIAT